MAVSKSFFHSRFLLLILLVAGNKLNGAAIFEGTIPITVKADDRISGIVLPIVEVRGDVPFVEYRGKEVPVSKDSMQVYENVPPDEKSAPNWILATNLKSTNRETRFYDVPGRPFNKELLFSVDLESPVAIEKVWIVMCLRSERGGKGNIVQEVGTLSPYHPRTVTIRRRLTVELGEATFRWHVFSRGREILNSSMDSREIEQELKWKRDLVRDHVKDAPAEPYLTFPPRNLSGRFVLEVEIASSGRVKNAVVVDSF